VEQTLPEEGIKAIRSFLEEAEGSESNFLNSNIKLLINFFLSVSYDTESIIKVLYNEYKK
jgi:hypothetical protein